MKFKPGVQGEAQICSARHVSTKYQNDAFASPEILVCFHARTWEFLEGLIILLESQQTLQLQGCLGILLL